MDSMDNFLLPTSLHDCSDNVARCHIHATAGIKTKESIAIMKKNDKEEHTLKKEVSYKKTEKWWLLLVVLFYLLYNYRMFPHEDPIGALWHGALSLSRFGLPFT